MNKKPVLIRIHMWQFLLFMTVCMTGILFASSLSFRHPARLGQPIRVSAPSAKPVDRWPPRAASFSFKKWIDSIRRDSLGRRWVDSLIKARPGLTDSIRTAEKYYNFLNFLKK